MVERCSQCSGLIYATVLLLWLGYPARAENRPTVIVASGAQGAAAYDGVFARWAARWEKAAQAGGAAVVTIGADPREADPRERLRKAIENADGDAAEPLWVVLLGHGTDDGKEPKFNFHSADLSASELAEWLRPVQRPLVLVCGFSASGAFLKPLSAAGRVVVCATRTGRENNFARFGGYLSETIADPAADLDKDGATSLLEAWLAASRRTTDFYKEEGRLATEHSVLDDNGDASGTPGDWFQGLRLAKRPKGNLPADGLRAHQFHLVRSAADSMLSTEARQRRDTLETELAQLRDAKSSMSEAAYFEKLEAVLLQIARIYRPGI